MPTLPTLLLIIQIISISIAVLLLLGISTVIAWLYIIDKKTKEIESKIKELED